MECIEVVSMGQIKKNWRKVEECFQTLMTNWEQIMLLYLDRVQVRLSWFPGALREAYACLVFQNDD